MKKNKLKKKVILFSTVVFVILSIIITWYLVDRFSYSKQFPYYSVTGPKDTVLTIGIIGDSWIEKEKVDSIVHRLLLDSAINSKVIGAGESSARTKFIYQNLFKEKSEPYSSRFIIESRPDYCILVAGVNDATGQIGSGFYSYHVIQIIKTLLHYNIKPMVLSLPEFGVEETPADMSKFTGFLWRLRNKTFAVFNNNGEIDNIKTYRKKLIEELVAQKLMDSVTIIDFDKVCIDYNECPQLYADRGHLSPDGKMNLCRLITSELLKKINSH